VSPWALVRQDENGQQAVVCQTADRAEAERMLAEYDARGHKQTYWIERVPAGKSPHPADPEETGA
jgi:hypothetical protein